MADLASTHDHTSLYYNRPLTDNRRLYYDINGSFARNKKNRVRLQLNAIYEYHDGQLVGAIHRESFTQP